MSHDTPWVPRMTAAEIGALLAEHFPAADGAADWITGMGDGWLELRHPYEPSQLRPGGTLSGPTLMTLADTAMYFMLLAMNGPQTLAVTSNLNIDFLRKPRPAALIARAELLRMGRALAVGRVVLLSEGDDRPVAHATVTYALPRSPRQRNPT